MQALGAHLAPLVNRPKHRPFVQVGRLQPHLGRLHRAQPRQRRHLVGDAGGLAVALAARQEAGHPLSRHQREMGHVQTQQFIATESPPEPEQHQRSVSLMAQRRRPIAPGMCRSDRRGQPVIELDQPPNLERRGLLDLARVQGLDAFEHLAHQRRPGRVDKAVVAVPRGNGGQPVAKRAGG